MAKVEICRCKYLLPCGYCDKYDMPCKANKEDMVNFYNISLAEDKKEEECKHEWEMTGHSIDPFNVIYHYVCSRCGEKKSSSLGF